MSKKILIVTFILLLLLSVYIFQSLIQTNKNFIMTQPLVTRHKLIALNQPGFCIEGNVALAAKSSSGNGTEENPYIIEDLIINQGVSIYSGGGFRSSPGYVFGIFINSTDKFFIIRNCSINLPYHPPEYDPFGMQWISFLFYTGIYLSNVIHGNLSNITISIETGSKIGFYLYNSSGNILSNNTFIDTSSQTNSGIILHQSNLNEIIKNVIKNVYLGIELEGSDSNSIVNNTINDNFYGLRLDSSNFNIIANNTILFNHHGIDEEGSQNNTFQNNILHYTSPLSLISWLFPSLIGIILIALIIFSKKRSYSI